MAPTAQHFAGQWRSNPSQHSAMPRPARRGLDNTSYVLNYFTPHQLFIQSSLAVTSACISIFSAIVVLYWFIRMRRSFRHHLIMILIQSDLFKAVWYLIFPAVVFTHGAVKDTSAFCQATGFFVALGIEASDFAILIIAVHAAIYIFRPSTALSEGGLYRYRYTAYVCWAIFPLLTASLAFRNHANPYISEGTYCYLPVRPFWYRLALSWVPRYLIFCTILAIYFVIFTYVKYKFKGVDVKLSDSNVGPCTSQPTNDNDRSARTDSFLKKQAVPYTPVLARHGLIASSEELGTTNELESGNQPNLSAPIIPQRIPVSEPKSVAPAWENYTFGGSAACPPPTAGKRQMDRPISQIDGEAGEPSNRQPSIKSEKDCRPAVSSLDSRRFIGIVEALRETRVQSSVQAPRASRVSSSAPLNDGPSAVSDPWALEAINHNPIHLMDYNGSSLVTQSLRRRHTVIRRQLRFLFIYPVVYLCMWLIPFAGHCLNYSDFYSRNPPYILNCFVVVIIPLQCAVDCWLFSYREKPWRYIPGSRGTFWNSFAFWTHDSQGEAVGKAATNAAGHQGPGKSQGEMIAESRAAYKRREEERGILKGLREEERRKRQLSVARRGGREDRSWWEEEGKRRQDSVWMGTDWSESGKDGRADTIAEEEDWERQHTIEEEQPRREDV